MKIRYSIIAVVIALSLTGAGCSEEADKAAEDAVKPIAVPVAALNEANEATAEINAATRREADSIDNYLPVAVVLTDGQQAPTDGIERLETKTFGCSDRIGYVRLSREAATSDVVRDALTTLFAVKDPNVGGLYNSIWQSALEVDKIQSTDGVTTEVWISGETTMSGACDSPRLKEQIEATIRQYRPKFKVLLNGTESEWDCFGDMSGECGL